VQNGTDVTDRTDCCIVGGGPAGMVLGLLLARCGVQVTVLELHGDFLRDFRGDTVHASTLRLLDQLGLGDRFAALPHQRIERVSLQLDSGTFYLPDFTQLPPPYAYLAMTPQWDLLNLLASAGQAEPTYRLVMRARVQKLVRDGDRVTGVVYTHPDGRRHRLLATLTVGCDGRSSVVREQAGLDRYRRAFGSPEDTLWFRLPRRPADREGLVIRFSAGRGLIMVDRGDYWQCAYLIKKGALDQLRQQDIDVLRRGVTSLLPHLADRVGTVSSWDDVRLLDVRIDRLGRWYAPGVLCLGDAAHAMSPIAGVGINLAVQDAVAAARMLWRPLLHGEVDQRLLARVQRRRWWPTVVVQAMQQGLQKVVYPPGADGGHELAPAPDRPPEKPDLPLRLLRRFPVLGAPPARLVGLGLIRERPPAPALRPAGATGREPAEKPA
jgi:2-polyprenyl-6-methoxyphenol hydroxylase-like FAD-dependent oxidoreductase